MRMNWRVIKYSTVHYFTLRDTDAEKKKTTNTSDPIIFFSFKSVLWAFIIQLLILLIHTIDILHYHNYVTYFLLDMHGLNERRLENIKRSQRNDVICYIFSSTIKLEYMYNIYQFMA